MQRRFATYAWERRAATRTIGKFGLGLKSVFHLGEAFFYFSSSSQPACEDGRPFAAWLSPWGESKHHRDWLGVEKHFGLIQSWLERWPHGHDRWFALWLPLRQRDFSPVIVKQFPRIEDFFTANLPREVCRAFPLLRFVERVNVWTGAEANTPTLGYAVTLSASVHADDSRTSRSVLLSELGGGSRDRTER